MIASSKCLKGPRQNRKPPIIFTCEQCGKIKSIRNIGARKFRFCSSQCANFANRGEGNHSWKGGHPQYYGSDWQSMRRLARKRDSYLCRRCGVAEKQLGRKLDVHHIMPVSKFENVNNSNQLKNLISFCHPCHQYVEWNGMD